MTYPLVKFRENPPTTFYLTRQQTNKETAVKTVGLPLPKLVDVWMPRVTSSPTLARLGVGGVRVAGVAAPAVAFPRAGTSTLTTVGIARCKLPQQLH